MDKDLKCSLLDHENPYLKVGPFRYEVKLKIPEMILIHNFVNAETVHDFIRNASGKLTANPLYTGDKSDEGT